MTWPSFEIRLDQVPTRHWLSVAWQPTSANEDWIRRWVNISLEDTGPLMVHLVSTCGQLMAPLRVTYGLLSKGKFVVIIG